MARFNFNAVPEIAASGAPGNDYERIATSPEMFGGAVGAATQKLGGAVTQSADEGLGYLSAKQQLTNEISASETNTWLAKNLTDKFNTFGQLEGKAAQDALPQFKQDVEDLHTQAVKNAGDNLQMQSMVERNSRYLTDAYYRYATNHADQQWRTWQTKTSNDRASEFGNQAAIAAQHGTWPEVDVALNTSDDEIRKMYEAHGLDSDSINAEVKKQRGKNVKQIVDTLSANGDPRTAQAVLDKYKTSMDAGSVLAVTSTLKSLNAKLDGRQIADEETGRAARGGAPPAPVAGIPSSFVGAIKWREGYDAVPRWDNKQWTIGYGTRASGPDERLNHDQIEQRFQQEITKEAKIVDAVNPHLDPGTRAALISLTHHEGEAWTHAGLGDAVRAGDLPTAQKKFLEYANVNGQPNAAIAKRRWDEAQWFGQAEAPAGHALPDKSEAYNRIVARTANDPLRQDAAISRMNQIFYVDRAEGTQNQVLFNQRVKDTTAEAFDTGTASNPLTENDFVQARGLAQGRTEYADYKQNLVLGADVAAAAGMSPQDRLALEQRYVPAPGAGYAAAAQRQSALERALGGLDKERAQDPAGYAMNRLPDVKAAYQGLGQVEGDPKATDDQRKAARANFAAVMQREQSRIGIAPQDQRLLSADGVTAMNKRFATAAASDDPQARTGLVGMIQHEANLWGDSWPMVMRQLAPQTQPVVRAIAAGADPVAMTRLLSLDPKEKPAAILKQQNETKAADLNKNIETAMAPFRATMVGRQVDRDYASYYNLATELGALYVRDGMSAGDAATKAFGDLIGNRYEFRDTWRLPKSLKLDGDQIQAGTVAARQQIAAGAIAVTPAVDDMALGANNRADSLSKFARDGRFVTSPRQDGLNLVYGDKFVRGADGQPLLLNWDQLAKLGGTKEARTAAARAALNSSVQP